MATTTNLALQKGRSKSKLGVDFDNAILALDRLVVGVNTVVQSNGTPAFNADLGAIQAVTLTANATAPTLTGGVAGQRVTFAITQHASAAKTWVWPTNTRGGGTIDATTGNISIQSFMKIGSNWQATGAIEKHTP